MEIFVSGYCRQLDGSRVVEAELEEGAAVEADRAYGNCLYRGSCPIAAQLDRAVLEQQTN